MRITVSTLAVAGNRPIDTLATLDPFRLMRDLMSWDPFAEMLPSRNREPMVFTPRFEVKETQDTYAFKADLPGIEDRDLGADVDRADADLKNGVLTISIPKRPEHQPRKISLKSLGEKVKGALGGKDKGAA